MANKVLTIDPDDPEAMVAIARVEVEQTKDDSPDKDKRLAESKKNAERALVTVDTDVLTSGYSEEQIVKYKNFLRSQAYFVIGAVAFKASNWPDAEMNLRKSIDAYPQQPDVIAVYRLALSLDFQNRIPEALKVVQQVIDLTKDNPESPAGKAARQERERLVAYLPSTPAPAAPAASVPSPNNSQSTSLADVMMWFDEPAPGPTTEVRVVVITARAYDGVLNILRKLRDSDTSVKNGSSILETGYHPPSFRLGAVVPSKQSVQIFHWDDEVPNSESLVMNIRVTRKVYDNVSNAVGHLQ